MRTQKRVWGLIAVVLMIVLIPCKVYAEDLSALKFDELKFIYTEGEVKLFLDMNDFSFQKYKCKFAVEDQNGNVLYEESLEKAVDRTAISPRNDSNEPIFKPGETYTFSYTIINGEDSYTASQSVFCPVPITEDYFPSEKLRNLVKPYDANSDGLLDYVGEIDQITQIISVFNGQIGTLSGIEYLTELEELWVYGVKDKDLDFSYNTKLKLLKISDSSAVNSFETANISKNTELEVFQLDSSKLQLDKIDFSNNKKIKDFTANSRDVSGVDFGQFQNLDYLCINGCNLSTIDVSKNKKLTTLDLDNNKNLTALDISNNTELKGLSIAYTGIENIDVSNCKALGELDVKSTPISSLDLSNNILLKSLYAEDTLISSLDLSQNSSLDYITINTACDLDISNTKILESKYPSTSVCLGEEGLEVHVKMNHGQEKIWRDILNDTDSRFDSFKAVNNDKIIFPVIQHTVPLNAVRVQATCDTDGTITYTCEYPTCKKEIIEYTPATGHKYELANNQVEATCTKEGHESDMICVNPKCDKVIKGNVIPVKEHTKVTDAAVAPTCTAKGKTEGSHCAVCNFVIEPQKDVDMISHKWDDGVVTKEATVDEEGIKTFTCQVCKASEQRKIEKLEQPFNIITVGDTKYKILFTAVDTTGKKLSGVDFKDATKLKGKKVLFASSKYMKLKGYTFKGWKIGDKKASSIKSAKLTDNMVLTAVFSENSYSITYKLMKPAKKVKVKGKIAMQKKIKYTDEVQLNNGASITAEGYKLVGWSKVKNSSEVQYPLGMKTSSLTEKNKGKVNLYPVWQAVN